MMADLQVKYQKLATEYSKLRAQVPVLKKAVLDEQAQQEELKDVIKERDQAVRQYEQEIDSLTFRNRQMSTRVSLLQEELDRSDSRHKNDKRNTPASAAELPSGDSVLGEELRIKIEENARLHRQVFEAVERHQQAENELQDSVLLLSRELSQQKQENMKLLENLQSEKAAMEVELRLQESKLKDAQLVMNSLQTQLSVATTTQSSSQRSEHQYNSISEQKAASSETSRQESITISDALRHSRVMEDELKGLIIALIRGLANLYPYSKQRCSNLPSDTHCQPNCDDSANETTDSLGELGRRLKSHVTSITELLPCQLSSIDEECNASTCTDSLQLQNRLLQTSLANFASCLRNLETHISLLTVKDGSHGYPAAPIADKFKLLLQAATDFHKATIELSKQFNKKVSVEDQASVWTHKWKQMDCHIASGLESLVTSSSWLAAFLGDNLMLLGSLQSTDSLDILTKADGVSGDIVASNGKVSIGSSECTDSLAKLVATLQGRLCDIEQEKEKWMLEMELQQVKYDKQRQKAVHLEEAILQMESRLSGDVSSSVSTDNPLPEVINEASTRGRTVCSSLLGTLERQSSVEESESREELIKNYFSKRNAEVTWKLQAADSKALHLHSECCALHNQLRLNLMNRKKLQEELSTAKELVIQVKDELQTTTGGYKCQLSTMSEHLAGMNEKLTGQKDEIDMLKYQLHTVVTSKKGQGK